MYKKNAVAASIVLVLALWSTGCRNAVLDGASSGIEDGIAAVIEAFADAFVSRFLNDGQA
ncbi:MAG: hypothetical protein AB7N71_06330 [Phycisphaerae bacterium]